MRKRSYQAILALILIASGLVGVLRQSLINTDPESLMLANVEALTENESDEDNEPPLINDNGFWFWDEIDECWYWCQMYRTF